MVTHSSILAWRILWTEEPGGLQATSVRVTNAFTIPVAGPFQEDHVAKIIQYVDFSDWLLSLVIYI